MFFFLYKMYKEWKDLIFKIIILMIECIMKMRLLFQIIINNKIKIQLWDVYSENLLKQVTNNFSVIKHRNL